MCGVLELSRTVFEAFNWTTVNGGVTLMVLLQW